MRAAALCLAMLTTAVVTGPAHAVEWPKASYRRHFILVFGGTLIRRLSGYRFAEDFKPLLRDAEASEVLPGPLVGKRSIYMIDVITSDGTRSSYHTLVHQEALPDDTHDPSRLGVRVMGIERRGHLNAVTLPISPEVDRIDVSVGKAVVKSLVRPVAVLKIAGVTARRVADGVRIEWTIENPSGMTVCVTPQFLVAEDRWESWPAERGATAITVNPEELDTPYATVDFRLIASDGFHAHVWTEPRFLERAIPEAS